MSFFYKNYFFLFKKRFPIFLHDDVKKELLELNKDSPENQSILEAISQHSFESFQEITTRRFIKTHFPFSLLPPSVLENGAKVSQYFLFFLK